MLAFANGWGGFTGALEQLEPAQPDGVPDDYVMQPFNIRLGYLGRHWLTVRFELGRDEIGSTNNTTFESQKISSNSSPLSASPSAQQPNDCSRPAEHTPGQPSLPPTNAGNPITPKPPKAST
jgi:hypothetical protein